MPDHDALVRRCQHGELAAFTELFRAFEAHLYRLALTILRDERDAEDAVQETYLRVFRQIKDYRGDAALRTWLTTIVVNCCRDHLRRARLRRMLPLEWLHGHSDGSDVSEVVHRRWQHQSLLALVQRLDDAHRLPVILFYLEDLPADDVAQVLGVKTSVVYSRLSTARQRLRALAHDSASPEAQRLLADRL